MKEYTLSAGITWYKGKWQSSDTPIMTAMSSGGWVASTVFDGLRAFNGTFPDADLHCQRLIESSRYMGHTPPCTWQEVLDLCWEGIRQFDHGSPLYVRPMIWADTGFIAPDPESAQLSIVIFPMEMPERDETMTAMITDFARPLSHTAPTRAKAAGLYPNSGLAILEARKNGYNNAILRDVMGNIAEFSASNLFIVKDGRALTPVDNGCFLCGITRKRALLLLQQLGIPYAETCITPQMLYEADEVISTGNYAKIMAVRQIDDVSYRTGEVFYSLYDAYHRFAAAYTDPLA